MTTPQDPHLDFWQAVHEVVVKAGRSLPTGDDPRAVFWDHPDELWKNEAALEDYEIELRSELHELVATFCRNQQWPKRSKTAVRFLLDIRLEWAKGFTWILTVPSTHLGGAAMPRPEHSGWDFIQWLLTDAYENRSLPQPYIPMYFPPPRTS
ncbi:hypothetical protein [Luteolibacter marinus]|uniref:hypothetical protein n=1 Tax=Luteolibacter marinus TaxID=2776705 RepID=UPI001D02DDAB|nr:hypothetical protein [Luteolibacter marinus]